MYFFHHPNSVCLNYYTHLNFSLYVARTLFIGSFKALIHSIYPDVFITSTSELLVELNNEMKKIGCRN